MTILAAVLAFLVGLVVGVWLPSGMFSPVLTWYLVRSKAGFFWRLWGRK